ncbi:hypothetical protein FBEOM_13838 [Fusarium beomiforme]|uniref:Uncharacterized protein n=1 Tax=Fusarium beomiforme TaxID=44412 RepID=A0A9P5A610_9HYPO|nr:hypothetical protein FBEOM_13838 [Fusarium beomiforme]
MGSSVAPTLAMNLIVLKWWRGGSASVIKDVWGLDLEEEDIYLTEWDMSSTKMASTTEEDVAEGQSQAVNSANTTSVMSTTVRPRELGNPSSALITSVR